MDTHGGEIVEVELDVNEVTSPLRCILDRLGKTKFADPKKEKERQRLVLYMDAVVNNQSKLTLNAGEVQAIAKLFGDGALPYLRWALAMGTLLLLATR